MQKANEQLKTRAERAEQELAKKRGNQAKPKMGVVPEPVPDVEDTPDDAIFSRVSSQWNVEL
jgi:hypothetical protein